MAYEVNDGSVWYVEKSGDGDRPMYVDPYNGNATFEPPIVQTVLPWNEPAPGSTVEVVNEIDVDEPTAGKKVFNVSAAIGWLILAGVAFKVVSKKQ